MNSAEQKYLDVFLDEIRVEGRLLMDQDLPELREEDFYLYQSTGNRLIYEGEYFGRRKFLTVFGILTECEKNPEYVDKLSKILTEVCKEKYWALPAHVNFDALDVNTIDLFAAETAQTLSEMVDLFWEKLSDAVKQFVLQEVITRVMKPFCDSKVPYSWWETDRCNWSAVCAGSIGMTAIHLDHIQKKTDKYEELFTSLPEGWKQSCIRRVLDALSCYLDGMEDDGACTEGLGYFSYGMSYFAGFAEMLYEDSNHEINLLEQEKCKKIAEFQQKCYFGKGISLSFSDGSQHENFLPGLTTYLSYFDRDVEIPDYTLARYFHEDACYRWLTNERNIRWLQKYGRERVGKENSVSEKTYYLPSAQWFIRQDAAGNGYAIKGGHNAENHNHNDVGHFLCVYYGEMLLTDLGAGEYTKDYFHEGRYGILCNRSLGHSVPIINGMEQPEGREHHADCFVWDAKQETLKVSFASAYQSGSIDKIERIISSKVQNEILVEDRFSINCHTKEIMENLIVAVEPKIEGNHIVLTGEQSKCGIFITVNGQENVQISARSYEHSQHDGSKVIVYGIQWNVECTEPCEKICMMKMIFEEK